MARRVLVDTGAWLAAFHRRDQYHAQAATYLRQLRTEQTELIVTELILAELHLHLVRGLGIQRAAEHLQTLKADPLVREYFTDARLQAAAFSDWIHPFADQPFTFTDAVSFAVMRAQRIPGAFTFDRHFKVAGFAMAPE
ncbi:MAG TPA: PIN domain-containing protein [Gemmatimonadales bacterium]